MITMIMIASYFNICILNAVSLLGFYSKGLFLLCCTWVISNVNVNEKELANFNFNGNVNFFICYLLL